MKRRTYNIKKGYKARLKKDCPFKNTGEITYQPDVYNFAKFILERANKKYLIVFGAGSGERLASMLIDKQVIVVERNANVELLRNNLPNAKIIEHDLAKGIPSIEDKIFKNAVVISSDVIECLAEPHKYLKGLAKISKITPYLIISTPDRTRTSGAEDYGPPSDPFDIREWSIDELNSLLHDYGIDHQIGFTISDNDENYKSTIVALSGCETNIRPVKELPILAVVTAYNEEDIIEASITHLLNNGLDVHIIDNWSSDKTFKIIQNMRKNTPRITIERFPKTRPSKHVYEWKKLLLRVEEIANKSQKYSWVIHNDADELRISPWQGVSLQRAISFVDELGYNAIDFTVADFRPTKDGFSEKMDPNDFFHDFEFTNIGGYFEQIKGWKNKGRVDLASSGGHRAGFPNQKVYPLKFLSKHYPLRSSKQAYKKIFKERKKDFSVSERKNGWHVQYDKYDKSDSFIWDEKGLLKFTKGNFHNDYFVERLSGVGIKRAESKKD